MNFLNFMRSVHVGNTSAGNIKEISEPLSKDEEVVNENGHKIETMVVDEATSDCLGSKNPTNLNMCL